MLVLYLFVTQWNLSCYRIKFENKHVQKNRFSFILSFVFCMFFRHIHFYILSLTRSLLFFPSSSSSPLLLLFLFCPLSTVHCFEMLNKISTIYWYVSQCKRIILTKRLKYFMFHKRSINQSFGQENINNSEWAAAEWLSIQSNSLHFCCFIFCMHNDKSVLVHHNSILFDETILMKDGNSERKYIQQQHTPFRICKICQRQISIEMKSIELRYLIHNM